nr:hypothetical protein [Burkholderia cepacia]
MAVSRIRASGAHEVRAAEVRRVTHNRDAECACNDTRRCGCRIGARKNLLQSRRSGSANAERQSPGSAPRGGRCIDRQLAIVHAADMRTTHTERRLASHSNPEGEVSMSTHICSREARAAQRFVEATRNVDQAFRAVRGESDDDISSAEYARAMSRLDRALDELARAQECFDRVVSADAAGGN